MTTPDRPEVVATEPNPLRRLELAHVARLHYVEGLSKVEIADRLGMSRFRIARMLDEALASGIVRIDIDASPYLDGALSEAVAGRFGLDRAVVAAGGFDAAEDRRAVAAHGAAAVAEIVTIDDIVGIGGGRTLYHLVSALPRLAPCTTVQLMGGVPGAGMWANAVDLARLFAEHTGGPIHTFLLPYLVSDANVAAQLRDDPSYARARSLFAQVTVALTAIGAWGPPVRSGLHDLLEDRERRALRRRGVVADVLGVLVSADGDVVMSDVGERSTGISASDVGRIPTVLAVSTGAHKAPALEAVLRSKLVSILVTDSSTARVLIGTGRLR